MNRFY